MRKKDYKWFKKMFWAVVAFYTTMIVLLSTSCSSLKDTEPYPYMYRYQPLNVAK